MTAKSNHVHADHSAESDHDRSSTRSSVEATSDNEWPLIDPAQVSGELRAQAMLHLQQTIGNQRVIQSTPDRSVAVQRQSEDDDYMHADLSGLDLGGIGQAWDTISSGVGGARNAWRGGVRGALGSGREAVQGAGSALWGGATGAASTALDSIGSAGSTLWSGVEGAGGAISSGFDQATSGDVLGGIMSGVGGTARSLWGGASGAASSLATGFGGARDAWFGGARGAIDSGRQGARNAGSALWGGATGAAGALGGAASGLWEQATGSPVPSFNWEDLIM